MAGPFKVEYNPKNLKIEKTAKPLWPGLKSKLKSFFKGKLVGWWKFDEGSGTTANDSAGKNNGTIYGAEWTSGKTGSALKLDGDDYVDIGTIASLGVEQTKMLWVHVNTYPLDHDVYLLDEGGSESNNNWIELCGTDNNGNPKVRSGFDAGNYFDSNGGIKKGTWYHVAIVSNYSGDVSVYINGVLDSFEFGFSTETKPKEIVIGADSGSKTAGFDGIIDDVRIYNYALRQDEIAAIYAGREIGRRTNLIPVLIIFLIAATAVILVRRRKKQ